MPSRPPSFPFYGRDYLDGTMTLTPAERGAYVDLLWHQWSSGGVPADDMSRLAGVMRCSVPQARKLWPAIAPKFERGPDGLWRNARLEVVRAEKQRYHEAQRGNGSKGGRPPKQETRTKPTGFDSGNPRVPSGFPSALASVPNGTENARGGTRHGDPHGQRLDPNAAFRLVGVEGQLVDVPAAWAQRASREHGLSVDRLDAEFRPWAGAWIRQHGYEPPNGNKLAWLDARLADWRAVSTKPAEIYRPAQEWIDQNRKAGEHSCSPEQARAILRATPLGQRMARLEAEAERSRG